MNLNNIKLKNLKWKPRQMTKSMNCNSNHDKGHKFINYDEKYCICEEHNKEYNSYWNDCKPNLCIFY